MTGIVVLDIGIPWFCWTGMKWDSNILEERGEVEEMVDMNYVCNAGASFK